MSQFILVSYDITDDRRRTKIMKTMEGFGQRVQFSVFECRLKASEIADLRSKIKKLVHKEDSVRFYYLCQDDLGRIEVLGSGAVSIDRVFIIH